MRDSRTLFLIPIIAAILGATAPAGIAQDNGSAQENGSHVRIVRLSYVQGTVQFNGATAVMNSPVTEQSRLVTGTDGLAEVQFEDGSAIRLASETELGFAQLARLSSGEAITRVDLDQGEAEFLIPASSAGHFAVNVRGKNILFKQPGRFRLLSTNSSPLEIAVWKGEAGVRDLESGQEVSVKDRETFELNPDDLGQYNLDKSVLADDLDRWSEQRDQDLRTNYVASNNSYNSYNSIYDQYQSVGPYGGAGFIPISYYGYGNYGCFSGFGFGQPFWFGSGGSCWNSGFGFQPWFFGPSVVVIVPGILPAPGLPRRPVPIRPPTVPTVARAGSGSVVAKPEFRSFRTQGQGQRLFSDETFPRGAAETAPSPETSAATSEGKISEATHAGGIGPGQRSAGSSTVAPPTHLAPGPQPSHQQHSSPPANRPPSPSHSSLSGSHGFAGGGFSHAPAPASHSSGRSR